jgi:3-hydroxyacyl-[acyl-carrier-protein] dehydratase
VTTQAEVASSAGRQAVGTVRVDPADPVFAGHYPGCPVLPGLYVLDHVDQVVAAGRVVALDRAKFLRPVRPGDELRINATIGADGTCVATVHTKSGQVAEFRLRYEVGT